MLETTGKIMNWATDAVSQTNEEEKWTAEMQI